MSLKAAPEWGDDEDVSPRSEEYLEFTYSRLYNAYNEDERVARLDEDTLKEIALARLDAHRLLETDDHVTLRQIEREIRDVQDGDGPAGVEDTHELDTAWVELLAEAIGVDGFDDPDTDAGGGA